MTTAEKVYYARKRWKSNFNELSFLLDISKNDAMTMYEEEEMKEKQKKLNDLTNDISVLPLKTMTRNFLYRNNVHTISDLLAFNVEKCGERKSKKEIMDMISYIPTVLTVTVADLQRIFAAPGYDLEFEPHSYDKLPEVVLPLDMKSAENDEEYSKLLYTKRVLWWEITYKGTKRVFGIGGRFKGFVTIIHILVWMHDQEPCLD